MGTNFVRLAMEQAPNAEGGANAVSSVTFDVPATEFAMNPNVELLERADEMRGASGELPHLGAAKYMPELSLPTRVYPGILGALLYLATGTVVTTAGDGIITDPDSVAVEATATRHVFDWKLTDPPKTCQITHGNKGDGLFYKGQGVGCDSLEFAVDGGVWNATAALKALYWGIISDPSITPSFETTKPFIEGMMTLTWLANSATTKDFSFGIQTGITQGRNFSTASLFPDLLEYADDQPWPRLTGKIGKQSFDSDDWNALINGTTFAAKIKLVHTQVIAALTRKHTLWVEMPACQLVGADIEPAKNTRRHGASYDWAARYDTSTSKWATITLVNATSTLETF